MEENKSIAIDNGPKSLNISIEGIVEAKIQKYRGYNIYAVRRKLSDTLCWWCGYVEIDKESIGRLCAGKKGRRRLTAVADRLFRPHGGFTYAEYGIDFLDTRNAILGWDYNHGGDREMGYTWLDVTVWGMAIIDSLIECIAQNKA